MVIDVITEWNHYGFLGFLCNGKKFSELFCIFYNRTSNNHSHLFATKQMEFVHEINNSIWLIGLLCSSYSILFMYDTMYRYDWFDMIAFEAIAFEA